jgi:hypothetical protein
MQLLARLNVGLKRNNGGETGIHLALSPIGTRVVIEALMANFGGHTPPADQAGHKDVKLPHV